MALHKDMVERTLTISFAADVVEGKSCIHRVPTGFVHHPEEDVEEEHADDEYETEHNDEQAVNFAEVLVEHACDGSQQEKDVVERMCGLQRVPTGFLYPQDQNMRKTASFNKEIAEHTCGRIQRVPTSYLYPTEEAKPAVSFDKDTVEHTRGLIRRVPTGYLYPTEEGETAVSFDNDTVENTRGLIPRVQTGYLYPTEEAEIAVSFDNDSVEDTRGLIRRVPTGFLYSEDMPGEQEFETPATFFWRDPLPPTADTSDEHTPQVDADKAVRFEKTLVDRPSGIRRVPTAFLRAEDMSYESEPKMEFPPRVTQNRALWRDAFPPASTLAKVSDEQTLQADADKVVRFEKTLVDRPSRIQRVPTAFLRAEDMSYESEPEMEIPPSATQNRALWRDSFPPALTIAEVSDEGRQL